MEKAAFLGALCRAVRLPGTMVADRFVEGDALAALLSGFGPLRCLALRTGNQLIGLGKAEIGQSDPVRCCARRWRNQVHTVLFGFFHIVVAAV